MGRGQGGPWSDADYAARGYGRLSVRLPTNVLELLSEEAEAAGLSRSELLSAAVLAFTVERARR